MRLIPTIALLMAAIAMSPSTPNKKQPKPQEQNAVTSNTPDPAGPVAVVVNRPSATEKKDGSQGESRNGPPIWSNWALVIVGLGAAILALRSLHFISEQAKAAEEAAEAAQKSANAALLNVSAMIQAERAWIAVSARKDGPEFFGFSLTNHGRTPAEILSITIYHDVISVRERFPALPRCQNIYKSWEHPRLLVPHEPWNFDSIRLNEIFFEKEELANIMGLNMIFLRYFVITYRDTLDRSSFHRTRAAYQYNRLLDTFTDDCPPAYCENT